MCSVQKKEEETKEKKNLVILEVRAIIKVVDGKIKVRNREVEAREGWWNSKNDYLKINSVGKIEEK